MLNLHWRMAGAGKETGDSSVKSLAPVWHGTAPRLPQFAISGPFARVGCDTLQRHNAKTQSWLKPVLFGQCWRRIALTHRQLTSVVVAAHSRQRRALLLR